MIVCPMLEDEVVFGIANDDEPKNVYVVEGPYTKTIRRKLELYSVPYSMMDEYNLRTSLDVDPDAYNIVIVMNPQKLHKEPTRIVEILKEQLTMYQGRFDAIAIYYGMCGNIGWDPTVWAKENTGTPVTTFHDRKGEYCDDCVSVAVGGREQYRKLVHDYTGILFLTPATATNWWEYPDDDTSEWESFYASRDDYMRDMFRWGSYKYALRLDTGLGDRENVDRMCHEVADKMELELIDPREPVVTIELASDIYQRTKALLNGSKN